MDTLCYKDEIVSLKWKNINLDNGTIFINKENMHKKNRIVDAFTSDIPNVCLNLLKQYKDYQIKNNKYDDNNFVFTKGNGKSWNTQDFNFKWYRFKKEQNIDKHITLHDLKNSGLFFNITNNTFNIKI